MNIHRFQLKDRNSMKKNLLELMKMCDYFSPLESWLKYQISNASDILYAIHDDTILGYLIADKKKTYMEIELICVGEKGRAMKGIGAKLMKEIEAITKSYGLSEILLDSQFQAEGFYKKLNYVEIKRNEFGVTMKKEL
jgi:ribosomal protein S18 acetylase RimI-like enzyme